MPASDDPDPGEQDVIAALTPGGPPGKGVVLGIGDDAAVLDGGALVTVDTMVEGVHWDSRLSAADVGWKLVAVNVSDIAAMGGTPTWAVLALSVPSPLDRAWIADFASGLHAACRRWGVQLVGGDTTRGAQRTVSLTLGGVARSPVTRAGGRPDDDIWVTGVLGLAAEGLLADAPRAAALAHLRRPAPRLELAVALAEARLPTAMMDLSDGLRADLARLCAASRCGAEIEVDALPGDTPLAWRACFGEDYELLLTAPRDARDAVRSVAIRHGVPITRVGRLVPVPGVHRSDGVPWPPPLFSHFEAPVPAPSSPRVES
jgi:thiamine-monophosphate kinase